MCLRSSASTGGGRVMKKIARSLPVRKQIEKKLVARRQAREDVKVDKGKIPESVKDVVKEPKKLVVKLVKDAESKDKTKPSTRKSNTADADKTSSVKDDKSVVRKSEVSEFSSDDDEPLLKVSKKRQKAKNEAKKQAKKSLDTAKTKDDKSSELVDKVVDKSVKTTKDATKTVDKPKDEKPTKALDKKPKVEKELDKSIPDDAKPVKNQTAPTKKSLSKDESKILTKKLISKSKTLDSSNVSDSDVSKGNRTPRPSRKTKEAATLYMELLGQRLNTSHNIDEDNSSLDSFPELPNVRKTEQMENELKAQNVKTGKSGKSAKSGKSTYSDSSTIKPSVVEIKTEKKVVNELKTDYYSNSETPSESEGQMSLYELNSVNIDKSSRRCNLRSDKSTGLSDSKGEEKTKRKVGSKKKVQQKKSFPKKSTKKVEKSFSESDEEPLALKISTKSKSDNETILSSKKDQVDISDALKKISTMKKCMEARKKAESTIKVSEGFSTNPVPSFEESQKVFGIAKRPQNENEDLKNPLYNKLYQKPATSRDVDTKIDLQRNKRKVNMSSEEIEKWLNESCLEPEPMEDDLAMSELDIKKFKETVEIKNKEFFEKPPVKDDEKGKNERKLIFHQKRNTLKITPNKNMSTKNKQAFSPDNETSVYSFCLDDQGPPTSTPFRQNVHLDTKKKPEPEDKPKLTKNQRKNSSVDTSDIFTPPKVLPSTKPVETKSCDTSVDVMDVGTSKDLDLGNMKSSIAVQCDFQSDQQATKITLPQGNLADFRNMEISTQTDYALANEGHLFYIPLQNSKTGENISEHLIQGKR